MEVATSCRTFVSRVPACYDRILLRELLKLKTFTPVYKKRCWHYTIFKKLMAICMSVMLHVVKCNAKLVIFGRHYIKMALNN